MAQTYTIEECEEQLKHWEWRAHIVKLGCDDRGETVPEDDNAHAQVKVWQERLAKVKK